MKRLVHIILSILLLAGGELVAQPCGNNKPFTYAGDDSTICSSQNIVYLNAVLKKANGATWGGGTGTFIPNNTTLNAQYVPSQAEIDNGGVTLFIYTTGNGNCSPHRDTVQITILKAPESDVTGPLKLCEYASSANYSVTALTGASYDWHVVGGTIASGSGTNSISVNWGSAGPGYIYCVQTDSNGCSGVGSIDPISRFNFSTSDLGHADVGADAVSFDSDAKSDGFGMYIDANCGSNKGLDLVLNSTDLDRGKMCMTFSWQRDESQASFFKRGNTEFYISGGVLYAKFVQDSAGTAKNIGPLNTGYTVPSDDVFRYFTFCYDSASGIARLLVNDSIAYEYNSGENSSLYWTGSGNAELGTIMDGNCSGNALLDWINIAIPISLVQKPSAEIEGDSVLCRNTNGSYSSDTLNHVNYLWTSSGGNIISGQGTPNVEVTWTSLNPWLSLSVTDTVNGCDSIYVFYPQINQAALPVLSGDDSLCVDEASFVVSSNPGFDITWSYTGSPSQSPVLSSDTFAYSYATAGNYYIRLNLEDTATGCAAEDSLPVWVQAYPTPSITGPSILCLNSADVFETVNTTNSFSWSLSNGNGSLISGQGSNQVSIQGMNVGSLQIQLVETDPYFGCETNSNKTVQVMGTPVTSPIQH
ncbi:MAG: hypothetical protein EP332_14315 [Bacteroidetes bacterium]|nr:MAG: hypothetical protein EP332_14315 [Bacteroidota bacterium]